MVEFQVEDLREPLDQAASWTPTSPATIRSHALSLLAALSLHHVALHAKSLASYWPIGSDLSRFSVVIHRQGPPTLTQELR
jgi:hypothetical protein